MSPELKRRTDSVQSDDVAGAARSPAAVDARHADAEAGEAHLPVVLHREREAEYLKEYLAEYQPAGPTEMALVRDLSRRTAAMERWGKGAMAVQRRAAQGLVGLVDCLSGVGVDGDDTILAAVMASEAADRSERHSLAQIRAFHRTRQALQTLQMQRKAAMNGTGIAPPFPDEAACTAYLEERLRDRKCPCPLCGETVGYALGSRRAWECGGCHRQVGLRAGTVMARSPLLLGVWFEAIRALLWSPTITTEQLAQRIGVSRLTTVRAIARRIRDAMAADNASELLAGLDQHFARAWAPEPGVPNEQKSTNQNRC